MEALTTEKPKVNISKVHKTTLPLISTAITAVTFILSNQELTIWSALIAIIVVFALAYLIRLTLYLLRYVNYLRKTERNHDRLMQLYGKKETEVVERDRIISSYPKQLIRTSFSGFMKGMSATRNQLSPELTNLDNKDINILEKSAGKRGVVLTFDVGEDEGIKGNMLLSIVTKYGNDLWGVVRIVWVGKNKSTAEVFTKINGEFWMKMEKEMYSDASPPDNVKARLYQMEDFSNEMDLIQDKLETKEKLHLANGGTML